MSDMENNDGSVSDISAGGESVASASSSLSPKNSRNSRTSPNCNKCKNHGYTELLRGHKRYCQFRDCKCEPCNLTEERRKVMAAQTRQKRAQLQDERAGVPLEERAPVLPARSSEPVDLNYNRTISEASRSPPLTVNKPVIKRKREHTIEDQLWMSKDLVDAFGVRETALPFALIIIRRAQGDVDIAKNIVLEAQKAITSKSIKRASMLYGRPSIFACGPNYIPTHSLPFPPYRPYDEEGAARPLALVHDTSRRSNGN